MEEGNPQWAGDKAGQRPELIPGSVLGYIASPGTEVSATDPGHSWDPGECCLADEQPPAQGTKYEQNPPCQARPSSLHSGLEQGPSSHYLHKRKL